MNRRYVAEVRPATLVIGALACGAAVTAIVALTTWLTVPAETTHDLPAPAGEEPAPGALTCPGADDVDEPASVEASLLIDCPDVFDNRHVLYRGEAIRAVLQRNNHAVVQVNDDPYADAGPLPQTRTHLGGNSGMTIIMPLKAASEIRLLGSYRAQGDLLAITGTFHATSDISGGEPAIHATTVEVVRPGHLIRHDVSRRRVVAAVVLAASTGFLLVWTRRRGTQRDRRAGLL